MGTTQTPPNDRWLVKVKHWDGGVSVISICKTQAEAERWARKFNEDYQAPKYYAELYDPQRGFRG